MLRPPHESLDGAGRRLWFVRLRSPEAAREVGAWVQERADARVRLAMARRTAPLFDVVLDLSGGDGLDVAGHAAVDASASMVLDTAPLLVGVDPDHMGPAIRSFVILRRNKALSWDEFTTSWGAEHGPLVMRTGGVSSRMVRYVQHRLVGAPQPSRGALSAAPVDGVAEAWFPDRDAMRALFDDPERLAVVAPDEERLLDTTDCPAVLTAD